MRVMGGRLGGDGENSINRSGGELDFYGRLKNEYVSVQ